MESLQIVWLKSADINRKKWDKTVSLSHCGALFGYTWYLDCVCSYWDALITPDYSMVMPIPIFSNKYPFMSQYLFWTGIYSADFVSPQVVEQFVNKIPNKYDNLIINFNKLCQLSNINIGLIRQDKIFEIDVLTPYSDRPFKMPQSNNIKCFNSINDCRKFFLLNYYKTDFLWYTKLLSEVVKRGHCMCFSLESITHCMLGCAVVFVSQSEVYIIDVSINKQQTNYQEIKKELLDVIIRFFSGKNCTIYIKTNKRGLYDSFDEETLNQFNSYQFLHVYYIRNIISKLYNFFKIK